MNSQTSLVAENIRLRQWAEMVRECQHRPQGMKIETWCDQYGITKSNYYYRLKRVRKACLQAAASSSPEFVDLTSMIHQQNDLCAAVPAAVLNSPSGLSLAISDNASPEFLQSLIGAMIHAQ